MGEDFVLDDRGVVVNKDGLDSETGNLGDHDPAEGIGDGGVDADEGELGLELVVLVELDLEGAAEILLVPGMFLVRIVVGIRVRDGVRDCFFVDTDSLGKPLALPLHVVRE